MSIRIEALNVLCQGDTEADGRCDVRVTRFDDFCEHQLCVSSNKVVWKKGTGCAAVVQKVFTSEHKIEQVFWCHFEQGNTKDAIRWLCIVDTDAITLHSEEGAMYNVSVPFKVCKVWPIKGGLLIERRVASGSQSSDLSQDGDGLPVLFTLTHPLEDICPVTSRQMHCSSTCVDYLYEPHMKVVATFEDPSMVVTFDTTSSTHAAWLLRKAETEDIPLQPPAVCRDVSVLHLKGTPKVMSSSAPEKFPLHMFTGRGTPILTPVQRLLFKTPDVFGSVQHHGGQRGRQEKSTPTYPLSVARGQAAVVNPVPRDPFADFLESGSRVPQRPEGAVRIGSGQTPMRMRHKPRIPQEEMDQSGFTARKAKSFSPIRSSPMGPHYSRSWSTVFCDPLVNDDTILESMGEPLLPEKCIELVWTEDPSNSTSLCTTCASSISLTRDIKGKTYIVFVEDGLGAVRLVEYHVESETKIEVSGSSALLSGARALPLDALNMMAVLTSDGSLHLYSGDAKVGDLHMDMGDFPGKEPCPSVEWLLDGLGHRFTMVFSGGLSMRCQLPPLSSSPLVLLCLRALQACLPQEMALHVTLSYYRWRALVSCDRSCDRSCDEWAVFVKWLLSALGVQHQGDGAEVRSAQEVLQAVPALRLLDNHAAVLDDVAQHMQQKPKLPPVQDPQLPDLQSVAADVVAILHLVSEELKLDTVSEEDAGRLVSLLYNLTRCYKWPCHVDAYFRHAPEMCLYQDSWSSSTVVDPPGEPPLLTDWLRRLVGGEELQPFPVIFGVTERTAIIVQLFTLLVASPSKGLSLPLVTAPLGRSAVSTAECIQSAAAAFEQAQSPGSSPAERVVKLLSQAGDTFTLLHTLPFGVSLPLWHCVYECQRNPSSHWPPEMYQVVGREDIAQSLNVSAVNHSVKPPLVSVHSCSDYPEMDMEDEVVRLVFREDHRVEEVRRCLQSSRPIRVALTQRPEVSDHQFLEEQEEHLLLVSQRTMALPVARGMFTLGTVQPLPATQFPIPQLNLSGRAPPTNTTISFDRIAVPEGMSVWPSFHNGVAAGLRITPNLSQLDASWVLANLTEQLRASSTEGGFLMGLGLNGHLNSLPDIALCSLFSQRNEMCTLGIFLGMSAARCGSCDSHLTSLVALHIRSLLPPGSADMDIPHNVEMACLVSLGLLHMASGSRHLVDTMLKEIACLPGPDMDNAVDRESHSLAAGLCLGMILLAVHAEVALPGVQKGNRSPGISDLDLVEKLVVYISGGANPCAAMESHKHKTTNQLILECSYINTHVTAPGAIVALGLAFLKTNDRDVAQRVAVPETYTGLLNIRPDFLLLRVLSCSLIMWESVGTSKEWVESWLPEVVSKWAFNTQNTSEHNIDIQGMSQAEVNLIAGACLSLGMRFAGTAHKEAFATLLHYTNYLLSRLESSTSVSIAKQPCLERCLNVALLSTAMVMSGTGDLEVFRLVRQLRVQVTSGDVTYGNHMVVHMALGLLFLGGCTRALDTSNKAVAAMVAAFYPLYPATTSDNRYHLQALRHLYGMATSPRLLLARNIHTNRACSVPVRITTEVGRGEESVAEVVIPLVGPRWDTIRKIEVIGERYWNFALEVTDEMQECLSRTGTIFVKERVGYFSYEDDPGGQQSSLSRALLSSYHNHDSFFTVGQSAVNIEELTRNPFAKTFAGLNCAVSMATCGDSSWRSYLNAALTECVLTEKLHLLPVYIHLEQMCLDLPKGMARPRDVSQFVLAAAFAASYSKEGKEMIISTRFLSLQESKMKSQLDRFESGLIGQGTGSAGRVTMDLASLLRGYIFNTSPSPCSKMESVLLVCLLILYSIPSPHQLQLMPEGSPQDLCVRLKVLSLPPSALLKLLTLFKMDPLQFLSAF